MPVRKCSAAEMIGGKTLIALPGSSLFEQVKKAHERKRDAAKGDDANASDPPATEGLADSRRSRA